MPASTGPAPAAGDGITFAAMPTKNAWTTTPNGTWTPKAWNDAHSTPMLPAQ